MLHEIFSFVMSLLAMSLEMYSARKERMGQGEVDGFTQRVKPVLACLALAVKRYWS